MALTELRVEKLTDTNYHVWRRQMRALLVDRDLWLAIGTDVPSVAPGLAEAPLEAANAAVQAAHAAIASRNDRAKALIELHVSPNLFYLIDEDASARQAWDALAATFASRMAARVLTLRRELAQIRMQKESVASYFGRVQKLREQLLQAGESVTDSEARLHLLAGLPSAYATVVELLQEDQRPLHDVLARLQITEQRLSQSTDSDTSCSAHVAASTSRRNVQCHYCKKFGHIQAQCTRLAAARESKSSGTEHFAEKCTYCGLYGHTADVCRRKKSETNSRSASAQQAIAFTVGTASGREEYRSSDKPVAAPSPTPKATGSYRAPVPQTPAANYGETAISLKGTQKYVIDSGASHHVTPHRTNLADYVTEGTGNRPRTVRMGDGRVVPVRGYGTMYVKSRYNGVTTLVKFTEVLHVPEVPVNLVSLPRMDSAGAECTFRDQKCTVTFQKTAVLHAAISNEAPYAGLYVMEGIEGADLPQAEVKPRPRTEPRAEGAVTLRVIRATTGSLRPRVRFLRARLPLKPKESEKGEPQPPAAVVTGTAPEAKLTAPPAPGAKPEYDNPILEDMERYPSLSKSKEAKIKPRLQPRSTQRATVNGADAAIDVMYGSTPAQEAVGAIQNPKGDKVTPRKRSAKARKAWEEKNGDGPWSSPISKMTTIKTTMAAEMEGNS